MTLKDSKCPFSVLEPCYKEMLVLVDDSLRELLTAVWLVRIFLKVRPAPLPPNVNLSSRALPCGLISNEFKEKEARRVKLYTSLHQATRTI